MFYKYSVYNGYKNMILGIASPSSTHEFAVYDFPQNAKYLKRYNVYTISKNEYHKHKHLQLVDII